MDEAKMQKFIEAGKLAAQVRDYGASLIRPGASLLDVTKKVEQKIIDLGAFPAFPVQISCDNIAAHFCPNEDDSIIFDNQLVSLDVGVHVDGAIGDTAYTVDLSKKHTHIVKAAQEALSEALKIARIGTPIGEIGKAIQETIVSHGLSPVRNLSGHGVDLYNVHCEPTIPNCAINDMTPLKKGQVIAIEPFATDGEGRIQESGTATVFMLIAKRPVRNPLTRQVLHRIESYKGLPFCTRWLTAEFGQKAHFALRELTSLQMLEHFPPLVEVRKGFVAQAEHTILIDEKPIVITK